MKKGYKILRKKYPRFIYQRFDWRISNRNLEIFFHFKIEPNIFFQSKIVIENVNKERITSIGDRALDNLVFHLGLMEIPSYWKATCSPEILIEAGPLNKDQIKYPSVAKGGDERKFIDWWKDLIFKGMGQFFYENKINFTRSNFLNIKTRNHRLNIAMAELSRNNRDGKILVPVGGGKDSVVTLEILKKAGRNVRCLSLNPTEAALKIMKLAGCQKPVIVRRKIDDKLLELNRKGFLNGHTPFSAYLAFLSVLVASIFDYKYIAFSNERSSNEGNVKYLGRIINHQWSKSFDFEKKFRNYSKRYLTPGVEYFSFLRPLYEIQIAKLFSRYHQYFPVFLSCNVAYQTASGTKKPTKKWCGDCPKCLFVFATLYPFVKKEKLIQIFKKNLFEDRSLLPIMEELIGVGSPRRFKPFECVGTKKESQIAFYLALRSFMRRRVKLPFLLQYFKKKVLPKYPNLEKESKKILNSWNNQHNLSKNFAMILKNALLTKI